MAIANKIDNRRGILNIKPKQVESYRIINDSVSFHVDNKDFSGNFWYRESCILHKKTFARLIQTVTNQAQSCQSEFERFKQIHEDFKIHLQISLEK